MKNDYFEDYKTSGMSLDQFLDSVERELVMGQLNNNMWNRTQAARDFGITFRSMRHKLFKLGIEDNGAGPRKTPTGFSKIWPKLREAAFALHGNQCRECGATPSQGFTLHVDHIKPVKHFPHLALDLSNLQILCSRCNLRKSDQYTE